MVYRVELSPTALRDTEEIYLWIREQAPNRAFSWLEGCYKAIKSLEQMPERCALAPESSLLEVEIRQLLYGRYYRILYSVESPQGEDTGRVLIHRVRHSARQRLQSAEQLIDDMEDDSD